MSMAVTTTALFDTTKAGKRVGRSYLFDLYDYAVLNCRLQRTITSI